MGRVHSRDRQQQHLAQWDELRLTDGGHTDGRHITCEKKHPSLLFMLDETVSKRHFWAHIFGRPQKEALVAEGSQ